MSKLTNSLIQTKDPASSRRFITLIVAAHFILSSFAILIVAFYVIFFLPKGKIEPELLGLLKEILQYDFYIIISGLGFISADGFTQVLVAKYSKQVSEGDNKEPIG